MAYTVMLVSRDWRGRRSLKGKGTFPDKKAANAWVDGYRERCPGHITPDVRVLGPRQLATLRAEIEAEQGTRRAEGAVKAAAPRRKKGTAAFVLCPTCGAKSKKLFSEMGGLQTRVCRNGHRFEHDQWLADRAFWAPLLTGKTIPAQDITRPVK